jgi:hypothetical protein
MKTIEQSIALVPDHLVDEVVDAALRSTRRKAELYTGYLVTLSPALVPYLVVRFAFPELLSSFTVRAALLAAVVLITLPAVKVFLAYVSPWIFDRAIDREMQRKRTAA